MQTKYCFAPISTPLRKAISFAVHPANDSTRPCKPSCAKRLKPEDLPFETFERPMAPGATFRRPIRCINKTAGLACMAAQPSLPVSKKNAVHSFVHPVKRNADTIDLSLRHVRAFARMATSSTFVHAAHVRKVISRFCEKN